MPPLMSIEEIRNPRAFESEELTTALLRLFRLFPNSLLLETVRVGMSELAERTRGPAPSPQAHVVRGSRSFSRQLRFRP